MFAKVHNIHFCILCKWVGKVEKAKYIQKNLSLPEEQLTRAEYAIFKTNHFPGCRSTSGLYEIAMEELLKANNIPKDINKNDQTEAEN